MMLTHGVSVFGSSPPVSVVSTGVGEGLEASVGVADGVALAVGVDEGVAVAVGGVTTGVLLGVAETVAVGVTAAAHTSLVMVLVSRVTAPLRASS
jgi:hypothetical protein